MSRPERAERRTDWSANKAPEVYAPNWDDYMDVLEGKKISKDIPRHVHQPMFGYWRVKVYKPGTSSMEMRKAPHGYEPIAFMPWNDGIICKLGNHTSWEEFDGVCAQWEKAKLVDPITVAEYKNWVITGKWQTTPRGQSVPDELADPDGTVVPMDGKPIVDPPKNHNAPPEDEPEAVAPAPEQSPYDKAVAFVALKQKEITSWIASLPGKKVSNQDEAERAAAYKDLMAKTRTSLDKRREEEKAPHLKAGRDVDAKYKPLTSTASDLEADIKAAEREFAIAEDLRIKAEKQRSDDIARKEAAAAHAAQVEADNARQRAAEADAAAAKSRTDGARERNEEAERRATEEAERLEQESAAAAARAAEAKAAPAAFSAGSAGRRTKVKMVVSAQINDYDAALMHFKDLPEIREIVQRKANAIIKAGGPVPGCSKLETPDV